MMTITDSEHQFKMHKEISTEKDQVECDTYII